MASSSSPSKPAACSSPFSDNFDLETKLVVLNFIGFNPHDSPSQSIQTPDLLRWRLSNSLPNSPRPANLLQKLHKHQTFDIADSNRNFLKNRKSLDSICVHKSEIPTKQRQTNSESDFNKQSKNVEGAILGEIRSDTSSKQAESKSSRDSLSYECDADDEASYNSPISPVHYPTKLFKNHLIPETSLETCKEMDPPKSGGFAPNLEEWNNFEFATSGNNESTPKMRQNGLDTVVDQILSTIIEEIIQEDMLYGKCDDDLETDGSEGHMEAWVSRTEEGNGVSVRENRYDDSTSSLGVSTSSVSLNNGDTGHGSQESVISHEISGHCCAHSVSAGLNRSTPGDRSRLRLNIKSLASPQSDQQVLECMRAELNDELSSLESELEEVFKNKNAFLTPILTPQSEAARVLARIGDEVREKYEAQIEDAVKRLLIKDQSAVTYEGFRDIAKDMVDHTLPGWRQVVMLLVYGQTVAWRAVETGHRGIGTLINHTSRLLSDHAADFIIRQGGWGAVTSLESSSENTPDSLTFDLSPPRPHFPTDTCTRSIPSPSNPLHCENVTANNSSPPLEELQPEFSEHVEIIQSSSDNNSAGNSGEFLELYPIPTTSDETFGGSFWSGQNDYDMFRRNKAEEFWTSVIMVWFSCATMFSIIHFSQIGHIK